MATGVVTWSKTAASNANSDSAQNWAEGMAPSAVNDSARGGMASVARWRDDLNGSITTSGTAGAYTVTTNQGFASLAAGLEVAFVAHATNTAAPTLAVDGLTAKPLRSAAGVELVAGQLKTGGVYAATYFTSNSGEWVIHSFNPVVLADGQVETAKIADGAVTLAKLIDASAQYKILARKSASAGDYEECSLTEVLDFVTNTARGDILYRGASTWSRLAKGTQNQTLVMGADDPAWGAPQAGVVLSSQTASGSSALSFTSGIDSSYRRYCFAIDNTVPQTAAAQFLAEVSDDGGSSWKSSSYISAVTVTTTTPGTATNSSTSFIQLSWLAAQDAAQTNSSNYGWSGEVHLIDPSNTSSRKPVNIINGSYMTGTAGGVTFATSVHGSGFWNGGNGAINAIRFRYSTGNITSGKITMIGLR